MSTAKLTREDDSDGLGAILDYIGKFMRFAHATFAVRQLKGYPESPSSLQKEQVKRCSVRVMEVLDWPLKLGPVKTDQLRYVSDNSWIMILFCCHFVVATCGTFTSIIPDVTADLEKVTRVAQLIMHSAVDQEQMSYIEAHRILKQVWTFQDNLAREIHKRDAGLTSNMNGNINAPGGEMNTESRNG
jgi:hypothetical protein